MSKQKGRTVQVYVRSNDLYMYDKLKDYADASDKSVSELISRGMECAALEQECNIQLTPGAYFAMQDGRFDILTRTLLGNGSVLISITEESYKPKDGSSGYENKVQQFLSRKVEK